MGEPYVEAIHVGKTFRWRSTGVKALVDATCKVNPGDRIALMGPSGSGKSTLLQLMAGLDEPTSGSINWPALGMRNALLPKKVGVVFQTQSLLPPLTVVENVALPLLLSECDEGEAREVALAILRSMELADLADKLPEELSGGQAQRVAVARALVGRPKLILADEPTGQLDHPTAKQLFDVLLALLDGSDSALVVATHDSTVAQRMDKVWHMRYGILEV